MGVVSSTIVEDHIQRDGRRSIRERHVDHAGVEHFVDYLAGSQDNTAPLLATHANQIAANEKEAEIRALINWALAGKDPEAFPFSWLAPAEGLPALFEALVQRPTEETLGMAQIAAGFTVSGLETKVGLSTVAANAVVAWAVKVGAAAQAVSDAEAIRTQLAGGA